MRFNFIYQSSKTANVITMILILILGHWLLETWTTEPETPSVMPQPYRCHFKL
ncbi:hypothetical protein QW573_04315 [Vibrio gallaecicus]|nr:hypothetical protein [Vibrio gallaecicus]MDN3613630.1 hypothetical protein [Vibrio gallaecicus]